MPTDVITRRLLDALRARGFDDVVPAHFAVLRYPGPNGKRPSDLAAEANMSRQAMNYLLRQLEQLGYVERRDDADDARAKRVYETARGTEVRLLLRSAMRTLEADWAAELGEPDLEQLRELLLRLNAITHGAAHD
jgi:DNA-binding MarR family transcriptional regulator